MYKQKSTKSLQKLALNQKCKQTCKKRGFLANQANQAKLLLCRALNKQLYSIALTQKYKQGPYALILQVYFDTNIKDMFKKLLKRYGPVGHPCNVPEFEL